jgi:uncharacterized ferredoxin-like protein
MLINERETRNERLLRVAEEMMTAARTAPKGKGIDLIEVALVTGETIGALSGEMVAFSERTGLKFITRDAENILQAEAIVLIGTKSLAQNLDCGYCGFESCAAKAEFPGVPCAINTTDVGIAIGSACAMAADRRVDSRVMFSAGRVAQEAGLMPGCTSVYAIPISCTSKNPFFDRVSKTPPPVTS